MKAHIIEGLFSLSTALLAWDNLRLRRRLRVDRLAREAEEALGPPHIGDIVMPDPNDSRWTPKDVCFTSAIGGSYKRRVLSLGEISVNDNGSVYIGDGPPLENSAAYGKRVLRAHRQRLVDQARGLA